MIPTVKLVHEFDSPNQMHRLKLVNAYPDGTRQDISYGDWKSLTGVAILDNYAALGLYNPDLPEIFSFNQVCETFCEVLIHSDFGNNSE